MYVFSYNNKNYNNKYNIIKYTVYVFFLMCICTLYILNKYIYTLYQCMCVDMYTNGGRRHTADYTIVNENNNN
jgi:hypothetical protein